MEIKYQQSYRQLLENILLTQAKLYKTFTHLNLNGYFPGNVHQLLRTEPRSRRDLNRIPTKLKLPCGAYTLQSNKAACINAKVNPKFQLCDSDEEPLEHFILHCSALEYTRNSVIGDISHEVKSVFEKSCFTDLTDNVRMQIILDCTVLVDQHHGKVQLDHLGSLEFHCRRLLHNVLGIRYRKLQTIPKKQR